MLPGITKQSNKQWPYYLLNKEFITRITDDSLFKALKLKQKFGPHVKARVTIRKNLSQVSRQIDGLICENSIASTQVKLYRKYWSIYPNFGIKISNFMI